MLDLISIRAGKRAMEMIQDEGLNLERVSFLAGASGSAKFLVLTGIDRALLEMLKHRSKPLYLLGTSIGAFRMAAFCQKDPVRALAALEAAYIEQQYTLNPTPKEITEGTQKILNAYIKEEQIDFMLHHPFMRISFLSNRCRGPVKSDLPVLLLPALAAAFALNLVDRKLLGIFFERALFHAPDQRPPFWTMSGFPINCFSLTKDNFKQALLSSGSIPYAMSGVTGIKDAPGVFRDGGILDYHLDIPFTEQADQLVLYPHFYDHVTPGWFDKKLNRKAHDAHMDNVVLVSPSQKFVSTLPFGRIPDRKDFYAFKGNDAERKKHWRSATDQSQMLGDAFREAVLSGRIRQMVQLIK